MSTLNDLLRENQQLKDEVEDLRTGVARIVNAWEDGDLAGAVRDAAALLPEHRCNDEEEPVRPENCPACRVERALATVPGDSDG